MPTTPKKKDFEKKSWLENMCFASDFFDVHLSNDDSARLDVCLSDFFEVAALAPRYHELHSYACLGGA